MHYAEFIDLELELGGPEYPLCAKTFARWILKGQRERKKFVQFSTAHDPLNA